MWGLEELLLTTIRVALDKEAREESIDSRVDEIRKRLKAIRSDVMAERPTPGDELHYIEFGSEYGDPLNLKDR
jgi:hypothetical protein